MLRHFIILLLTITAAALAIFTRDSLIPTISTTTTRNFAASPSTVPAADSWHYPVSPYTPGSYSGRTFFCCAGSANGRHLGEDVALTEGTPIRAIGRGLIKVYDSATGYGELVVVIEHDLGKVHNFKNGYGNNVSTRHILSIYGHLRRSQQRGGQPIGLVENQLIEAGTIIGYVNDDAHNGDGAEHLHMGLRLSDAATAEGKDASWFRGYERTTDFGKDFAPASVVISALINECCGSASPAPILLTEENSERAIAFDSVTMLRDPLPVITGHNFSGDSHTRVLLFAVNAEFADGEPPPIITAQAMDARNVIYPLTVESIRRVPNYDWLTQVSVRLPDEVGNVGDISISIKVRGLDSNRVLLRVKSP